jgi:hypothetical protein
MAHGTEQHLEHAEHAHHAALNPFDRLVAMTMAIIAAALASVTLLSHRAHNDTLRLKTEATTLHTKASDVWSFYQAKNIRSHEFQAYLLMLPFLARTPGKDKEAEKAVKYFSAQVDKYEGKPSPDAPRGADGELAKIKREAEDLVKEAKTKEVESEVVHHSVNWIDFGHLGLEFALVLCAVAVLTKQRGFWLIGLTIAFVGGGLALRGAYGMFLAHH